MADVLDSRPVSNLEFLLGRCLGLILMSFIPVLLVAIGLQAFGSLALLNGWSIGEPLEPYSVLAFLLSAVTALTLWCAIVIFISVLVRNRLAIAVASLGLLGLQYWVTFQLPIYMQPIFTILPSFDQASDLVPVVASRSGWPHYVALWTLAAGFIALATGLHPRNDGGLISRRLAAGAGLLTISAIILLIQLGQVNTARDQKAEWLAAHDEHRSAARVDVLAISGTVLIDPAHTLQLDIEMRVRAPSVQHLNEMLFTFNPGLAVESVSVNGVAATWGHISGLLKIVPSQPLSTDVDTVVRLKAGGFPDTSFGYLDSAIDIDEGDMVNAQLMVLGADVSIFTANYVALMPGSRWLPKAGSDVPGADPRTHPDDYFEIDLEVQVPQSWLVAGPGRRRVVQSDGSAARFRFQPGAPVTEVGLISSRFERRSLEVAGVELEILLYPEHDRNLTFFADSAAALEERLEDMFAWAQRIGLPYPYGGLSLVEVPNRLRGYTGGWRMDTSQSMPGLLLLKENSFPAARFEVAFEKPEEFEDDEGGIEAAKVAAIERFFENDFNGGNIFTGVSRNFLRFQTGARGEGALGINFVLDELVNDLLTGKRGYFSAHEFTQQAGMLVGQTIIDMVTGRTDSIADAVLRATTHRASVWDRALGASLADLEPNDDPRQALNVLALKGRAIAGAIVNAFGKDKTGDLLATLLERFRGSNFNEEDLREVASELDMNLDQLLGDWLHESALPGFVVSAVKIDRLVDDDRGNPRYQTRVHIRNDEPVPGLLKLNYSTGSKTKASEPTWHGTEPFRFAGHESLEIGILSVTQPYDLYLSPYLSLNRQDQQLSLPEVDPEARVNSQPFLGARPSTWKPVQSDDIIVDDLDDGFTIETNRPMDGRIGGATGRMQGLQADMDQGLPVSHVMLGLPLVWSRNEKPGYWGKYRKTCAVVSSGDGTQLARFTASLPHSGTWRLAYHLVDNPQQNAEMPKAGKGNGLGIYNLTLVSGGNKQSLEFDASAAEAGWNDLGEFELAAGDTQLEVSDKSSGPVVTADAVRWRPKLEQD